MWMGVIIAILISVTWFIMKLKPQQATQESIRFDLLEIKSIVETGCSSIYYSKDYNPRTEVGFFKFNKTNACINSSDFSDCVLLPCNNSNEGNLDLAKLTSIRIAMEKNLTIIRSG